MYLSKKHTAPVSIKTDLLIAAIELDLLIYIDRSQQQQSSFSSAPRVRNP